MFFVNKKNKENLFVPMFIQSFTSIILAPNNNKTKTEVYIYPPHSINHGQYMTQSQFLRVLVWIHYLHSRLSSQLGL